MKPWNWMHGVAAAIAAAIGLVNLTVEAGVKRAVIVGVDAYSKEAKLPELKYAGADAVRIEQVLLESGYRPEHIRVLRTSGNDTVQRPTRDNIRQALRDMLAAAEVQSDDTVMVVFAGHGFNEQGSSLLCPADFQANVSDSAIRVTEIAEMLAESPAAEKYVVIDACRNELIAEDTREFNLLTGLKKMPVSPQEGQGIVFFSSCLAGEQSHEDGTLVDAYGGKGAGVFLHFFARGLSGFADYETGNGDGKVSPSEAIEYAAQMTTRHVQRRFDARQTPWSDSHATSQLVIAEPESERLERVKQEVGGTKLESRMDALKPIARKQAESRFDDALGTLVQGDRKATIRYATQAIEMDEQYYMARRIRSLMYQIEGNSNSAQAVDYYRKAIADMESVGSRLRIPLARSISLKNGTQQKPFSQGDVLMVEDTQVYNNQVWLKVTGVSRRNPDTGIVMPPQEEVGFIELALVANPETTRASEQDLNRSQKPLQSDVRAQQLVRTQPVAPVNRPIANVDRDQRIQNASNGLGIAAGITSQIPGASRVSPWLGTASGILGRIGR